MPKILLSFFSLLVLLLNLLSLPIKTEAKTATLYCKGQFETNRGIQSVEYSPDSGKKGSPLEVTVAYNNQIVRPGYTLVAERKYEDGVKAKHTLDSQSILIPPLDPSSKSSLSSVKIIFPDSYYLQPYWIEVYITDQNYGSCWTEFISSQKPIQFDGAKCVIKNKSVVSYGAKDLTGSAEFFPYLPNDPFKDVDISRSDYNLSIYYDPQERLLQAIKQGKNPDITTGLIKDVTLPNQYFNLNFPSENPSFPTNKLNLAIGKYIFLCYARYYPTGTTSKLVGYSPFEVSDKLPECQASISVIPNSVLPSKTGFTYPLIKINSSTSCDFSVHDWVGLYEKGYEGLPSTPDVYFYLNNCFQNSSGSKPPNPKECGIYFKPPSMSTETFTNECKKRPPEESKWCGNYYNMPKAGKYEFKLVSTEDREHNFIASTDFEIKEDGSPTSTPTPARPTGSGSQPPPTDITPLPAGGLECNPDDPVDADGKYKPGAGGIVTAIGCVPTDPLKLIQGLFRVASLAGGGIALLLMIAGAFQMITSAGNPENVKKGTDQFSNAAIGLLFIIFSVMLLQVIGVQILDIPGFE